MCSSVCAVCVFVLCAYLCVWPVPLAMVWPKPTPVACFPAAPPCFSVSVDSGRDGQALFRISWLGRSGVLKREQLCPKVDTKGPGLCSVPWCPRQ